MPPALKKAMSKVGISGTDVADDMITDDFVSIVHAAEEDAVYRNIRT